MTLSEYMQGRQCKSFTARPHYFRAGDHVTYFFNDERAYEVRVDDLLTVYYSMTTNEMVGCKIKGVQRLLKTLGNFGVIVECGEIMLGVLCLAASSYARVESKEEYERVGMKVGKAHFNTRELQQAA